MNLPAELKSLGTERFASLLGELPDFHPEKSFCDELSEVLSLSDFVYEQLRRHPQWIRDFYDNQLIQKDIKTDLKEQLTEELKNADDEDDLKKILRLFRNRIMIILAWQDLTGRVDIARSVNDLSVLAETLIVETYHWMYNCLTQIYGTPVGANSGKRQEMLIIGMGKLGGHELNFSSDIDLIFCYEEKGETVGGRRTIENQNFFTRLGQMLIGALHQITADGQVFRVDMRLRPFGEDGSLVVSFAAMEDYYIQHGRSWERYAMVKARVLGDYCPDSERELRNMLRPFVFRRYFDFGAIDSLRKMKAMIEAEVRRRGLRNNIKLGEGGIREVEFVTQVFQLMRGGREPELQKRNLSEALQALSSLGVVTEECCTNLLNGYYFLRKTENILQEIGDQQTQVLPESSLDQMRVASAMNFATWEEFLESLSENMRRIHEEFREVVRDREQDDLGIPQVWLDIWRSNLESDEVTPLLQSYVGDKAAEYAGMIVDFRKELLKKAAGPQGRETLNLLMPKVLNLVTCYNDPLTLFERVSTIIRSIITRTTYIQLLYENSVVLDQVIKFCSSSAKIADQFRNYPILMDELIYPENLYEITTDAHKLRSELRQHLLRVERDDIEQQMEILRQFKQIQLLKISASDIVGKLTLMRVSDFLTELAEAIVAEVINIAWKELADKYGEPPCVEKFHNQGLLVVAFGKLGGIELGYGSDLDLVFLHYPCEDDEMTNGTRCIPVKNFYARLVRRIVNLFSIRTSSGILYEIDLRLRPDGDSGVLVSSIDAFERYEKESAWTWEHQALVRSRAIYGSEELQDKFETIRRDVLSSNRDKDKLREDVASMRDKMRNHLIRTQPGMFDLKQSPGGMVDIEFLAQYYVLAYSSEYPGVLTKWSDNVRIFDSCVECGLLPPEWVSKIKQSYLDIRNLAHRCSLQGIHRIVPEDKISAQKEVVTALWKNVFGEEC